MIWIVLPILLVFLIYYYESFRNLYDKWKKSKAFPGPTALPFVGNMLQFAGLTPPEIFQKLCDLSFEHDYARLWFGTDLNVVVSNPKDIETILSSQQFISKSKEYERLQPWLGTGLLLSTGKKWHSRRKMITPSFHFKILEQFVDVFERQGDVFIKSLAKRLDQKSFEFYPLITMYALDVICETAMGISINAQQDTESSYVKAVKEESHIMQQRVFKFLLRNDTIYKYSSYAKAEQKALKTLHGFTDSVIGARRKELAQKNNQTDQTIDGDESVGVKRKEAFLDLLLKSTIDGQPLSDADIREEVDTFMFEGHDTTTSAITFIMYNLAKYPDIQEKCYQETIDVIGDDKSRHFSYTEFSQLNYLEKVIKESLRIYPSVPVIGRYTPEECEINGKIIPAKTSIVLHFFVMGRKDKYFNNPLEFRPERFDNPEFDTFAYVPFSAGPRNCIGQKFAMLEMKSAVSKVLRNYKVHLAADNPELILYSEAILRPHTPILFRLSLRV